MFLSLLIVHTVSPSYTADIYFTLPKSVYITNEAIEFKGYLYQANYSANGSLVSSSSPLQNTSINLTIRFTNGTQLINYTFTTDSGGSFYSKSTFYPTATNINISSVGNYYIRAEYKDPNNTTWFSEVQINVVNQTLDYFVVRPEKARYNPSEAVKVNVEAIRIIGDDIIHVSNASINGTLRNSSKSSLQSFNCTTASNGKCSTTVTAPSTYGDYILELNNFKAFSSFSVVPFSANTYMKDELGKSLKNVFAIGEQGKVEVSITNASSLDIYTFSGYIANSSGSNIKTITSTTLNSNNSFTNTFLFTADALTFSYGSYIAQLTITKTGDGSITSTVSFEVKDWKLAINKRTSNSGFEYEYSAFPNKTLNFEVYPTNRSDGSVITNISSSFFSIYLADSLNNVVSYGNATWNTSCGKGGCYEFSINASSNTGKYTLYVTLANQGTVQTESQVINVISAVISAQSTDKDGNLKELFGVNEYAYISLTSYNRTATSLNLTEAEVFLVSYMNGSEFTYTQVNNFDLVNTSNSVYEWAWNSTNQRLKLDAPKAGGLYNVFVFGNNRTAGTNAKFIINPYDICIAPKDTPGSVTSGYYYVWQFKTSDTIYFEIKLNQANNPSGRATAINSTATNSSSYGTISGCTIDTTKKQAITNATLTVMEVRNQESGALQNVNVTDSSCQASDNSGTYTCTIKPSLKWDSGTNIAKFNIQGQDSTTSIAYGKFEARSFYLYGWSQTWQNSPSSNITLNVQLYEAGGNWWSTSSSSGGLSGTITVKKVEYQGSDGEWIWPPIGYNYNLSNISSATITSGTGSISLPASKAPNGVWRTGYYRVILQATTSSGDTDYGYASFGVKLWDVYGQPVECLTTGCNYKNYFSSKENISLYIKISKAGDYSYNYVGGDNIWGNISIGVKKIQDCRTWPCKELNSSQYSADKIYVNASSPWYWNANAGNQSNYILRISPSAGTWNTGYYSVILDVNGTDTGYAWFNTIAFYVETQPTDNNGSNYKYSIRGNSPMYFNVTTVKSYKSGYWYNNIFSKYNSSDYINVTVNDIVLRTWDQQTYQSKEYNYPENLNFTPNNITGNGLLNITYNNGTWPTGYYWGELVLKNLENETSTAWLWFNVQPFRVQVSSSTYNIDSDRCINASLNVYDPDWYSNSPLVGNYSIINVYEDTWTMSSSTRTNYTNYTSETFNGTSVIIFCPNNNEWSSGSWGGYHYLNIVVKDNVQNDTQTGWLSFKTVPFQISWTLVGSTNKLTNAAINVSVNVSRPLSGAAATGNLTKIYQWRYDNYKSIKEEYVFSVGSCYSNVSGKCTVTGTQNVIISPPSGGWKVGYNYLQAEWTKQNDSTSKIEDWSGVYFEGRSAYNGYFSNTNVNGDYKHDFVVNENITIRLYVRDSNYNAVDANITGVQYAYSGSSCWNEWCRTYTTATYSPTTTTNGSAILRIQVPSTNWSRGDYYIKATISGSSGTATITDGNVRVKDLVGPNITISAPVNNATYTNTSLSFSATTNENSLCSLSVYNYDIFHSWNCGTWNTTLSNSTGFSAQSLDACNTTKYSNYNGNIYYIEWVSNNYRSTYNGSYSTSTSGSFVTTGGTSHTYTFNTTDWKAQYYGLQIACYDDDWNYVLEKVAFKVNATS
ncbi:hypothetical protein HY500_01490 [Candidatus Woesearchaeota archaeon]|nr:hypothetical protein [Candidatus Woesearchaeota archaeon]